MKLLLRDKINGAILLTFACIAIMFSSIQLPFQQQRLETVMEKVRTLLQTLVERDKEPLANEIFEKRTRAIKIRLHEMLKVEGMLAISVFDESGTLLLADGVQPAGADLPLAVQEAGSRGVQIWQEDRDGRAALGYLQEIQVIGERIGFIQVYYSLEDVEKERRKSLVIFGSLLGSILVVMLVALNLILSRTILQPITFLRNAMARVRAGELGRQIAIVTRDEIGDLAESFNDMSAELSLMMAERARAEDEVRRHRDHLEELVKDRTAELSIANEHLQQEVAERKRTQEELQNAKDAAEAANQAKSAFLSNMSHELRTPLNAILGFSQLMARSQLGPPEYRANLDIIIRNGEHLLTLVNQVLDLSKIEAERTTLNPTNCDLYRLLHDVEDMFQLRAEEKHLRLLFERDARVPHFVRADEVKLRQVLINLLNNAVKFTTQGSVTVRILDLGFEILDLQDAHLQASQQKSKIKNLKFEIIDTGPGIAPEEMEQVFEAFGQTETGRQAREGTGLGLPISRRFIQLMGGDIHVDSEVGKGTVFTFDIQAQEMAAADVESHETTPYRAIALKPGQRAPDGVSIEDRPYRMLIVDDRPDNRRLLVTLLSPFGFELREATNGQKALDIWEDWEPHLIWMDLRLPVMDGYEATKRIRKLETGNFENLKTVDSGFPVSSFQFHTKIIAVTASSYEEKRAVAFSVGCDDYLRKPFKDTEIFEMVHKHLGVQFVYEEEPQGAGSREQGTEQDMLMPAALAALPAECVTQLEQGVVEANPDRLLEVIEHIREFNADLADVLTDLVKNFAYDAILSALQNRSQNEIICAELMALPPELLNRLEYGAKTASISMIHTLIDEVRSHNSALADTLAGLAKNFDYDQISTMIQGGPIHESATTQYLNCR